MPDTMIKNAISAILMLGITGISTTAFAAANQEPQQIMSALKNTEKCYGIAKIGQNDCGALSHGCAGEAQKEGLREDWIATPTGLCNKISGATTIPPNKT